MNSIFDPQKIRNPVVNMRLRENSNFDRRLQLYMSTWIRTNRHTREICANCTSPIPPKIPEIVSESRPTYSRNSEELEIRVGIRGRTRAGRGKSHNLNIPFFSQVAEKTVGKFSRFGRRKSHNRPKTFPAPGKYDTQNRVGERQRHQQRRFVPFSRDSACRNKFPKTCFHSGRNHPYKSGDITKHGKQSVCLFHDNRRAFFRPSLARFIRDQERHCERKSAQESDNRGLASVNTQTAESIVCYWGCGETTAPMQWLLLQQMTFTKDKASIHNISFLFHVKIGCGNQCCSLFKLCPLL
ncbi:hypothetical protein CEXT_796131 [Caerostris extrusa]|uniref:Uncharacterized protein n=1 Tax=Caerostris extrusa TaxID=172846 RepID=A0AAV4N896_CAEEX|nr:hypothetical protein CEXT_796131 [Caerostris extrusa]